MKLVARIALFGLFAVCMRCASVTATPVSDDDDVSSQESSTCRLSVDTTDENGNAIVIEYDISPLDLTTRVPSDEKSLYMNYRTKERGEDRKYDYLLNVCRPLVNLNQNSEGKTVPTGTMALQLPQDSNTTFVLGTDVRAELSSLSDGDLRYIMGPGDKGRTTTIFFFCADVGYVSRVSAANALACFCLCTQRKHERETHTERRE
eukprot:m.38238 g.38238  ORF g.38238 m.38238 type:complete len:205 (-) comp10177_c0_seq1:15-629(-)